MRQQLLATLDSRVKRKDEAMSDNPAFQLDPTYREQGFCQGCGFCYEVHRYGYPEDTIEYYCNSDNSEIPRCGSVKMNETWGCGGKFDEQFDAWAVWNEGRKVSARGKCDNWQAKG
jgi:hypothetical protein